LGLFGRAKALLQGSSPPSSGKAQFYRVACVEGHVLDGQRTDGYQALRCPTCGEGIFVLPRSPLPEPVAPASSQGRRPAKRSTHDDDRLILTDPPPPAEVAQARAQVAPTRTEVETQIEWVDEVEPQAPPVAAASRPETSVQTPPPSPVADPKPGPSRSQAKPVPTTIPAGLIEVEDRPTLGERLWRRRNALIFTTVALIVALTIGFRLRQRHLEALPAIVEIGRTQGLAKLDTGDFHVAKKLLGEAASAVETLGGQVEGADAIRQGAREAALFADLVDERLETLVQKAAKAESETAWASNFTTLYKGQSIILEAQITAVPDPEVPGSGYDLDYRIYYGSGPTPAGKGRIDLTGFRLFELEKPNKGESKVFGARLASMQQDEKGEWLIQLVPDSGCFITHDKALLLLWGSTGSPEDDS